MKIKTLVAVLLLSGGVTSTFAQTENCNSNSSISHEAVRAGNFKDAYAPCMAVLKDCPTLRYYTFTDAQKILVGFLSQIKDRNSADYKKYFDELMDVYDLRMKYIPEFINKGMKGVPSVADALGAKAVDYLQFAPTPDLNTAYNWLKESVQAEKGGSKGAVLHYFLDVSMQKVKADDNHTDQFFQDYIDASKYADDAIAAETKEAKKANLQAIKDNLVAMFIQSGVADCESLQNIYGPKVEENKTDSTFLKKALNSLKLMIPLANSSLKVHSIIFSCSSSSESSSFSFARLSIFPDPASFLGKRSMYARSTDVSLCWPSMIRLSCPFAVL